jgi:hypothetical protein
MKRRNDGRSVASAHLIQVVGFLSTPSAFQEHASRWETYCSSFRLPIDSFSVPRIWKSLRNILFKFSASYRLLQRSKNMEVAAKYLVIGFLLIPSAFQEYGSRCETYTEFRAYRNISSPVLREFCYMLQFPKREVLATATKMRTICFMVSVWTVF